MHSLILPIINFLVLVGVLFYLLRKPTKDFVKNRHDTLSKTLKEVRQQLREAQEKVEEFSAKLKAVQVEETAILEAAKKEALEAQTKILNSAAERSNQLIKDAKDSTLLAVSELKSQLREEFAQEVIVRAEKLISQKLTGEDRVRIRKEFSNEVGQL